MFEGIAEKLQKDIKLLAPDSMQLKLLHNLKENILYGLVVLYMMIINHFFYGIATSGA